MSKPDTPQRPDLQKAEATEVLIQSRKRGNKLFDGNKALVG